MKYILSVSIFALLFLLCSCGEQKVESVTSIAEEPNKPEIILTEESEEPVGSHLSPESSIVPDSIKILGTWISEEDKNWKLIFNT